MKLRAAAAVAITTALTSFSVTIADASTPPTGSEPSAEPSGGTDESTTEAPTTVTVTLVVEPEPTPLETDPPADSLATTAPDSSATLAEPAVVPNVAAAESTDDPTTSAATSNPVQVGQDQTVVVTATVQAEATTGSNTELVDQPSQGGSQLPAEISTGDADAVGSNDHNVVSQGADVVLADEATANVLQIALILNIGAALANSGLNLSASSPGGSGASGSISTGDASATGLDIDQYITQASRQNGDADTDARSTQIAISMWTGVATADTGGNAIAGTGVSASGGTIGSGDASATGNDSSTDIEQYAEILGIDQSTINVTQRATVLNVGFALANSGLNDISGVASGLLTAGGDDDELATQLFAMLLPAMLQSYGYGPAQGSISTGDATAVGNESDTFVRQVALAASSGDGVVDIVQEVMVANVGAAGANTGGNSLGSVRTLDPETASAVVTMSAFMAELLSLIQRSANDTAFNARSQGIEIPFNGLLLRLDGSFEALDSQVSQGGAQANLRQVSIIVSLGIAEANSGGNVTTSQSSVLQGNRVNSLQAGDAIAVLALDAAGNVIATGNADAANSAVVVMCQRIDADDVDCLEPPPPTTTPPSTTPPSTTPVTTPVTTDPSTPGTTAPSVAGTNEPPSSVTPATDPPAVTAPLPGSPGAFGFVPTGTLPATGADSGDVVAIAAAFSVAFGGMLVLATRRRTSR